MAPGERRQMMAMLRESVLQLCRVSVANRGKVIIDGIICISMATDNNDEDVDEEHPLVIKLHETYGQKKAQGSVSCSDHVNKDSKRDSDDGRRSRSRSQNQSQHHNEEKQRSPGVGVDIYSHSRNQSNPRILERPFHIPPFSEPQFNFPFRNEPQSNFLGNMGLPVPPPPPQMLGQEIIRYPGQPASLQGDPVHCWLNGLGNPPPNYRRREEAFLQESRFAFGPPPAALANMDNSPFYPPASSSTSLGHQGSVSIPSQLPSWTSPPAQQSNCMASSTTKPTRLSPPPLKKQKMDKKKEPTKTSPVPKHPPMLTEKPSITKEKKSNLQREPNMSSSDSVTKQIIKDVEQLVKKKKVPTATLR